ncbi:MAG: CRISPR-associated CARF protein Csa3 [Acidilobaceae archaeon]
MGDAPNADAAEGKAPVYLFGVGFDEKLVIRAVLRVGVKPGETAMLAYSSTAVGEFEKAKVENAVRSLRKILEGSGVRVEEIQISAMNFPEDVSSIVKRLERVKPGKIIISLGSGMRYLAFALLLSSLLYRELFNRDSKIIVHVGREDGLYDVTVNLSFVEASVRRGELEALCVIYGKVLRRDEAVKRVSEALSIRPSTFYKLLERMQEDDLVTVEDGVIKVTELGAAIAAVGCFNESGEP